MPSPFKLPCDMDNFLRGYPNQSPLDPDDLPPDKNLRFYQNEIECQPDDITIDEIHQKLVDLRSLPIGPKYLPDPYLQVVRKLRAAGVESWLYTMAMS